MIRYLTAVVFVLLLVSVAYADENAPKGVISGSWVLRGHGPVDNGLIYAFNAETGPPPLRAESRRVPDLVAITNKNGEFSLELPEGTYYLSTLKKKEGAVPGPPQEGDLHGLSRDKKRNPLKYKVTAGKSNRIGVLYHDAPFKEPSIEITPGITGITGTIFTTAGTPFEGVIVQIYTDQDVKGKPAFVSARTGKNGRYLVKVDREGTYYLTARSNYGGGRPQNGDLLGVFGGEAPQAIKVNPNSVTRDIDIHIGVFIDQRPDDDAPEP